MARKPDAGARDRILDSARRLFSDSGVHAVGLQQIIDECGCGKNQLYRQFPSKDDLVLAVMERCRQDWQGILDRAAQAHPDDPAGQLLAVVADTAEQAVADGFRGCPLRNAFSEFPDRAHRANQLVVAHYTQRQTQLRDLAQRAHAHDPDALADRIALIIDGVNANGPVLGSNGAANSATAFAQDAITAATRTHR